MLFLSEQNIKEAVSMKDVIDAVDATYSVYASGEFQMPERMHVQDGDNTLLLMPCFTSDAIATKLVTIFPNNETHPTLHGLVVLSDNETGEVKSVLNGSFLTGMRTGAIGGSAVRHLAGEQTSSLAVIGTGTQGFYQTVAACTERPIEHIYLYNRSQEKIEAFKTAILNWIDSPVQVHPMSSAEEAIRDADIVITATTSKEPVLPDFPDLLKNKLFIGIGSFQPTMREFPQSLYSIADTVMVDTEHAIAESGDIATPLEEGWINKEAITTMSHHVTSESQIYSRKNGTILFKSTGMALFDVVVANLMYQKAQQNGTGTNLSL
ncbi:ornithine cyclodeaminase family protein [Lentibacillus cibarius]|uniref:Ornithine cyclodeaminase family protein n=1 Tax=Lentibacillus cibarius TaxID=2583219 RepID=A0A549YJQ1_9BACI|nr:ornithine cyclodeaminase family protein [Lentibacillus cibarius]TRM12108.1 ornithine cyclodeaminase family protein [Lentibacillus cibarius]